MNCVSLKNLVDIGVRILISLPLLQNVSVGHGRFVWISIFIGFSFLLH